MTTTSTPSTTAVTPASAFQQLRHHLTDLRLTDAAEALPAVLDQAQAEGWSLTQALERLLAIEFGATDARRLAGRLRFFFRVPTVSSVVITAPSPPGSRPTCQARNTVNSTVPT